MDATEVPGRSTLPVPRDGTSRWIHACGSARRAGPIGGRVLGGREGGARRAAQQRASQRRLGKRCQPAVLICLSAIFICPAGPILRTRASAFIADR
jgi:hypothetical protein